MSQLPDFDLVTAHRYFSTEYFNRAWDLIDKPQRTADEDENMILLGLASLWHWKQRPDCTSENLSIGYWQVSRIYARLGQGDQARHYGYLCWQACQEATVLPFYLGYAYEALARAEMVTGNTGKMGEYLEKAFEVAERISDLEAKKQLWDDLKTIHQANQEKKDHKS